MCDTHSVTNRSVTNSVPNRSVTNSVTEAYTPLYADCLRAHLLRYCPGSLTLSTLLTANENEWLGMQLHKPLAAARVLGDILAGADIHPVLFMNLQANLDAFIERGADCEKILTTPIPLAYFRHAPRCWCTMTITQPCLLHV